MCKNIFEKIIKRTIPANIIYQDQEITAFHDINPVAPIHILIVPNVSIKSLNEINKTNKKILGEMIYIAVKISKQLKISNNGYRLIINCNNHGGQEIKHLHIHLLGGKKLNKI
ncbi:MAG: histidine triad nucleotide-binding protein [Buchnera aphidicola (Chaetogeoica yunlongensis)]